MFKGHDIKQSRNIRIWLLITDVLLVTFFMMVFLSIDEEKWETTKLWFSYDNMVFD